MKFLKRASLEKKLVVTNLCFLLAVFSVSVFSFKRFSAGITEKLVNGLESRNKMLVHDVSSVFNRRYSTIKSILNHPELMSKDPKIMETHLNEYVKSFAMYELIVITDKNGELIASNTLRGNGKPVNSEQLKKIHFEQSDWFEAVKNNKLIEDQENGFVPFYYGRPAHDRVDASVFGGSLILSPFTFPLKGADGKLDRVLTVFANFSWLEEEIKRTVGLMASAGHSEGLLALFDANKDWFYSSRESVLASGKKYEESELRIPAEFWSKSFSTGLIKKADGTQHYVAVNKFEDPKFPKSMELYVVQSVPESSILGEYRDDVKWFYISVSIIICLLSTLAFFLYRSIAQGFTSKVEVLGGVIKQSSLMSDELSSSAQQMSAASSEQASAIQETVSALSEMTSMIAQTSNSSQLSLKSTNAVSEKSETGRKIMDRMSVTMKEIEDRSAEFVAIHQAIRDIQSKTAVINDIVFKTQLLSFNASIEAARAGQEGRGFAVVAEEVGNLAKMSGNAAKEIENLLIDSERRVSGSIDTIRQSVNQGSVVGVEAKQSFNEIANLIHSIREQVGNVAQATRQQQLGIEEANKAMKQLDVTAHQNYECAISVETQSKSLFESTRSLTIVEQQLSQMLCGVEAKNEVKAPLLNPRVENGEAEFPKNAVVPIAPREVQADDDTFKPAA